MSLIHDPTQQSAYGGGAMLVGRSQLLSWLDAAQTATGSASGVHLDLDRFHHVNSRYGHDVGDRVLNVVAHRVVGAIDAGALVAAVDGDGFLVILPGVDLAGTRLEVATARRNPDNDVAVLLVDLDGFKEVNDAWGHAVGDDVLRIVATRLRSLARPSDTVARTGGDEFVLLCPETDRASAVNIGHRIVTGLAAPLSSGSITIRLGASIGVAHHRGGVADPDAMLIAADHAMYAAKRNGRGGVDVAPDVGPAIGSPVLR